MATNSTPLIRPFIPPVASPHPVGQAVPAEESAAPRQTVMDLLTAIPAHRAAPRLPIVSRGDNSETAPHLGRYVDVVA